MPTTRPGPLTIQIRPGAPEDRDAIYALRHDVYAVELGQHPVNSQRRLSDALDEHNRYLVAESGGRLIGFISITPPSAPRYSVEKYLARERIPVPFDGRLFEVRILTVAREFRRGPAAMLLMQGAMHAVRDAGGRTILVMGRREVAGMYRRLGLRSLGLSFPSGAVTYEVMAATVDEIDTCSRAWAELIERLRPRRGESAGVGGVGPAYCDHGGAFFRAVGDAFEDLSRRERVINADVLDAWFPPAPGVVKVLREHLPWLLSTSPPTHAGGMVRTIAEVRGVAPESIVVGAGSSALIFLALRRWLTPASRVLVLDPMYAEYEHVLSRVVGCAVERLTLSAEDGFGVNPDRLDMVLRHGYDLVVLVNPNNPTGRHLARSTLEALLHGAHPRTRVLIDEAYIDYAGPRESLEPFAAASANVVVCKSLSKAYALSGARAAYLVAPVPIAADLRSITPPWAVSLPAQVCAVHALRDEAYYTARRGQTHALRAVLVRDLSAIAPWRIVEGVLNSVMCLMPAEMPTGAAIVHACREHGLFVRDCSTISPALGDRALRIAVKDPETNTVMVRILARVLAVLGAR